MRNYGTRSWRESIGDRIPAYMKRGEFDKALQIIIEKKQDISFFQRRFIFACIQDGLSGHKTHRRVIQTAIIMIIVNLLIQPLFMLQALDAFAFLSQDIFYYNYYAAFIPNVINLIFIIGLLLQWHTWVVLPHKLFSEKTKVKRSYTVGFFTIVAVVSAYAVMQLTPLILDLPMVHAGEYRSRIITREEHVAMIYGGIILESESSGERLDIARELRRVLKEDYGLEYPDDSFPRHYYKREKWGLSEVILIYIEEEGRYYSMSTLKWRATKYSDDEYPIVIKYLPNSRIVLQIDNTE